MIRRWVSGLWLLASLATPLLAYPVAAQILNPVCDQTPEASVCQDNTIQSTSGNKLYGPDGILTKVANILSLVVGVVSLFVIFISGIRFITSGGDSSKVNAARNNLLYALIGLAVAALAQFIVIFVLNNIK